MSGRETETLERAIHQAIKGGWLKDTGLKPDEPYTIEWRKYPDDYYVCIRQGVSYGGKCCLEELIYDADFARALWGEDECSNNVFRKREYASGTGGPDEDWYDVYTWEFHTQQMVISQNPIEYLADTFCDVKKRDER